MLPPPRRSALRTASTRRRIFSCRESVPKESQSPSETAVTARNVSSANKNAILASFPARDPNPESRLTQIVRHKFTASMKSNSASVYNLEHRRGKLNSCNHQAFRKFRANTSCYKVSDHFPVISNPAFPVHKDVLHGHDISLHARDFGNAHDLPSTVAETADLNNQIDR